MKVKLFFGKGKAFFAFVLSFLSKNTREVNGRYCDELKHY